MRLFVALDIDPDVRRRLAEFSRQMQQVAPGVRWVAPETFHVTLQFLGETDKREAIETALAKVNGPAISLHFAEAGFFPNPKAPRVFWAGIHAGEELSQLAKSVATQLKPLGFEPDRESFKPHLTLARSGSGRPRPVRGEQATPELLRVRFKLETMPPPEFGTMTAHEFCLYESKLSPRGPHYTKLARFPLAQPNQTQPLQ